MKRPAAAHVLSRRKSPIFRNTFPDLEILERIGLGGMGCVYKARQRHLDRLVALKILPLELGSNPKSAERFAREARALARLIHPNIVTIHDFGEAAGMHYLVMEYMDGMSLRELMDADRLSPAQSVDIMTRTCAGLQYAHDAGIVHRDIKPENILFDRHGHLKIADFGLAKLAVETSQDVSLTGSRQAMGTLHYMAPEQWEAPAQVDHRADVYALGVLLYEMTTGRLPMGRFDPPSMLAGTPETIDEVVMSAMQREPNRRMSTAKEIVVALSGNDLHAQSTDAPIADSMADSMAGAGTFTKIVNVGGKMKDWIRESPPEERDVMGSMKDIVRRAAENQDQRDPGFPVGTGVLCLIVLGLCATSWMKVVVPGNNYRWENAFFSSIQVGRFEVSNDWIALAAIAVFGVTLLRNRLRFRGDVICIALSAYAIAHIVAIMLGATEGWSSATTVTPAPLVCGVVFALILLDRLLRLFLRGCNTVMDGARSIPWGSWVSSMQSVNQRMEEQASAELNEFYGSTRKAGNAAGETAGAVGYFLGRLVRRVITLVAIVGQQS